jgi:hydroxypyruvate isomerase
MTARASRKLTTRREALAGGALALTLAAAGRAAEPVVAAPPEPRKRRIKQSFAWGCYMRGVQDPAERIKQAAAIGFASIEMGPEQHWKAIQDAGMQVAIFGSSSSLTDSFTDPKNWDREEKKVLEGMERADKYGIKRLLLLTGNRKGRSDAECLDNCAKFLERVAKPAEQAGIRLCLELLNSKVNHPDYFLDHTALGVEVCKRMNSPAIGLLYDIYHMQIMEGDLIRTITQHMKFIGHFHTGGNPGRKDMDDQQEIYYPAVMRGIADAGYDGFVGHEFGAKGNDIIEAMKRNFAVCDV